MAILDSVNELAKRFGVETEEQTISEQIDAINQKLDESYTGSRDIEESVSQFAKNDGPDARLGTKTITENDTYIALDDELDGYSSVTVNVESGFTTMITYSMDYDTDSAIPVGFYRSADGNYQPPTGIGDPLRMTLLDPVIKVIAAAPGMAITFTPDENFDGFYSTNGNKKTYTGDTVVPGDGKVYRFITDMGGNTMLKTNRDFSFIID